MNETILTPLVCLVLIGIICAERRLLWGRPNPTGPLLDRSRPIPEGQVGDLASGECGSCHFSPCEMAN